VGEDCTRCGFSECRVAFVKLRICMTSDKRPERYTREVIWHAVVVSVNSLVGVFLVLR